ncbi:hypothetical protein, partial [Streptomyces sp. NPDC005476]|uniref:hypothetical protein n=1 Tax=Streptomyces sp. NPDC005476 TaxID=3156882 RepID=UPI00345656D4
TNAKPSTSWPSPASPAPSFATADSPNETTSKDAPAVELDQYQKPQVTNDHVNSSPGNPASLTGNELPAPLGKGCKETGPRIYCATVGRPADMTSDERSQVAKGLRTIGVSSLVSWCDGAAVGQDYIKRTEGCVKKANEITNTIYSKLPNGEIWPVGRAIFASRIEIKTDVKSNTFTQQWSLKPLSFRDAAGEASEWGPLTLRPKFTCAPQCATSAPTWSAPATWSTTGVDYHEATATFTHTVSGVQAGGIVPVQLIWNWDNTVPSKSVDTSVGVRYGSVGDLSFSIGYGPRQETLSQFDTPDISHGGAHTYELYFMAEHPNVPPPHFRYNHDGVYEVMCDLNNDDWTGVVNVLGDNAELVAALEADRRRPMEILEQRFGLTLPKEAILTGTLPAAIIKT